MLSNRLAAIALSKKVRPKIIQRTRNYIRNGFPVLQKWVDKHETTFRLIPPQAAAIAFLRYDLDINSTEFTNRLVKEKSVLIVPGDHFGMDHFVRISFGLPHDYLTPALDRIHELIMEIKSFITDYICHIYYFVFYRPFTNSKKWIARKWIDWKVELWWIFISRVYLKKLKRRIK